MIGGTSNHPTDWDQQREQLSAYLDGELSPPERAQLEQHLAGCAECRRELEDLRQVRLLLHAMPTPRLPRSFALPAAGAVPEPIAPRRAARSGRAGHVLARTAQWTGSIAAAVGLLLVLGGALSSFSGLHGGAASMATGARPLDHSPTAQYPTGTRGPLVGTTPGIEGSPTATPTATATPSPTATPAQGGQPNSGYGLTAPPLPLTGAGLVAGGAVLVVAGTAAERRRRRSSDHASRAR